MDLAYHDDGTCMPEEILSSDLGCNLTDGGINLQCVLSLEQSILAFDFLNCRQGSIDFDIVINSQ